MIQDDDVGSDLGTVYDLLVLKIRLIWLELVSRVLGGASCWREFCRLNCAGV